MDFFGEQERALKRSGRLFVLFLLGIVGVIFAVYFPLAFIFSHYFDTGRGFLPTTGIIYGEIERAPSATAYPLFNWELFFPVAVIVTGVISAMTLWKNHELSSVGAAGVAESLGGREVLPVTTDFREIVLRNVVEEMALASGSPAPRIFILPGESSINAFAVATSPRDAAVGVTRGALEKLSREELQGVIAHEMSHIFYGDSRLNVRMISLVFGLLGLTILGRILFDIAGRAGGNRRDGASLALVLALSGLILVIVGWISVLFGRILQAAINRQREFLADAAAVQYTRNPNGISGALKKIGGYTSVSELGGHANDAAHMMFADPLNHWFGSLLASHPPLPKRIKKIDPTFNGEISPQKFTPAISAADALHSGFSQYVQDGTPSETQNSQQIKNTAPESTAKPPHQYLDGTNLTTTAAHTYYASAIRRGFPQTITEAITHTASASAICHLVLLSPEAELRKRQLNHIAQHAPSSVTGEIHRLRPAIDSVPREKRLWLVDLAIPALRGMSAAQASQFVRTIEEIILMDGIQDLFEFALEQILRRHLLAHHRLIPPPIIVHRSPRAQLSLQAGLILSAIAHADAPDTESAKISFTAGATQITNLDDAPAWHELEQCTWPALQAAIDAYCQAAPSLKKNLLQAAATTALRDNHTSTQQWELLRAIADAIDAPLPLRLLEHSTRL